MTLLQAAIGATNDLVDAPRDAARPDKPIPTRRVSVGEGRAFAVVAAAVGLALSVPSGPGTLAVAVAVLGVGLVYDLRLKGTAWSWLPFAAGIPLLPVYAWLGAVGSLPPRFAVLVPAAVVAGAALAIGNALADLEHDAASGTDSLPRRLGAHRAWGLHVGLYAALFALAAATLVVTSAGLIGVALVPVAGLLVAAGSVAVRRSGMATRQAGWALEAVGVALLAAGWVGAAVARG